MNFGKLLPQELFDKLADFEKRTEERKKLSNEDFLSEAANIYLNSYCPYAKGDPVYNGVLHHEILPELFRRLLQTDHVSDKTFRDLQRTFIQKGD